MFLGRSGDLDLPGYCSWPGGLGAISQEDELPSNKVTANKVTALFHHGYPNSAPPIRIPPLTLRTKWAGARVERIVDSNNEALEVPSDLRLSRVTET